MPSVDFLLARLTAQTGPIEPRLPGGGVPELTNQDIAVATGQVKTTIGYYALMAKRCQSDLALDNLFAEIHPWAWNRWRVKKRPGRVDVKTHSRVVEVSVLYFLNPVVGQKRGDRGSARFVGVARKTWALQYRAHHRDISAYLFEQEGKAAKQVANNLR